MHRLPAHARSCRDTARSCQRTRRWPAGAVLQSGNRALQESGRWFRRQYRWRRSRRYQRTGSCKNLRKIGGRHFNRESTARQSTGSDKHVQTVRRSGLQTDGKERSTAPHTQPALPVDLLGDRKLDQLVEDIAMDQRLKIVAYQKIRRRLLSRRIDDDAQWVLSPRLHLVVDVGGKAQDLCLPLTFNVQQHRYERRVIDRDTD